MAENTDLFFYAMALIVAFLGRGLLKIYKKAKVSINIDPQSGVIITIKVPP